MGRALILESSFFIDLEREHRRGTQNGAVEFLERLDDARLYLPAVVAGELAAGVSMANRQRWEAFLAPFFLLPVTPDVAWEYSRTYRHLRGIGQLIGANDLWIGAHALTLGLILVTNNEREFKRIPKLKIENWTK